MKIYFILLLSCLLGCGSIPIANSRPLLQKEERFQAKVKIGMTKEQVQENWGTPDRVIKKEGRDFDEIWIYVPHWKFKNYLYFKDGVLIRGDPNPEDLV